SVGGAEGPRPFARTNASQLAKGLGSLSADRSTLNSDYDQTRSTERPTLKWFESLIRRASVQRLTGNRIGTDMSFAKHLRTPAIVCTLLLSACNSPDEGHVTSKQQELTAEEERVLAFEQVSDWQVWSGSGTLGQGSPHSEGSQSLAVSGLGYAGVRNTLPLTKDAHPAPEVVGYDVLIPTNQVNPYWSGDTQLMIDASSAGIHSQYVGYRSFAGLPKGEFTRVEFPLPDWIRQALNAANYNDLRFVIALNVPPGSATHYLDRFILGPDPGSSECTPVDDGNPCTADDCNPATGQTTHLP